MTKPLAVGRFAPSPTGPLHLGSLVAAVGSYLFARASRGQWIVRMEDLDRPRCVAGADSEILRALERYALEWDGPVVRQSERLHLYEEALAVLTANERAYPCACSRAELARTASAPAATDDTDSRVYPGTCRSGLGGRTPRSIRFAVPHQEIRFIDLVHGPMSEDVSRVTGDFVVRRADGVFAYQLAVVVDDEIQGVTQVVRGADLLSSTARQIALQQALGYRTPEYAHLPVVVNSSGEKLGKRDGALSLELLDDGRIRESLRFALRALSIEVTLAAPREMLAEAVAALRPGKIGREVVRLESQREHL